MEYKVTELIQFLPIITPKFRNGHTKKDETRWKQVQLII